MSKISSLLSPTFIFIPTSVAFKNLVIGLHEKKHTKTKNSNYQVNIAID